MGSQERNRMRKEIARDLGETHALEMFFQMQPKSLGVLLVMIAGNEQDAEELKNEFLNGSSVIFSEQNSPYKV